VIQGVSIVDSQDQQNPKPSRLFWFGWIIAIVVIFCASAGFVFARQARLAHQTGDLVTASGKGPRVLVVPISGASTARTIQLPASVHGYIETSVYAKVAGYLKTILIDKGDHVRKGQIIAIIESPETDQQVADALANYRLQLVTDRRDRYLLVNEVIPQQAADTQTAAMLQAKATYEQELALQRYEVVTAPFDGIISARFVDPGALIPQSTTPTTGLPIVAMATLAPVRIYAYVPQSVAPYVNDGDTATVTVTEFPGRKFAGTVTRHPEALDQNTRTMLVEVDLPNPDRSLLPGMYADVNISTRAAAGGILVPDDALVFRNNKIYLPLVRGERVHLAEVALGRDDGYQVEVTGDVQPGDLVAMNLSQAARDNELVQPVQIPGA
jgi:RND family efflux transporter MFP subunit